MSSHESPTNELDRPAKRRIQRRHGACEPCRSSKTKCDGRTPCGACRSERRRQCPCVYSEKAIKLQLVTAEIRRRAESEKRHSEVSMKELSDDDTQKNRHHNHFGSSSHGLSAEAAVEISANRQDEDRPCTDPDTDNIGILRTISVCAAVDEFKRLRTVRGDSAQVIAKCDGFEVAESTTTHKQFQCVSQSCLCPPLRTIPSYRATTSLQSSQAQALSVRLNAVDQLVRDGHLTRAWVDIASLVREGQLINDTIVGNETSSAVSDWRRIWDRVLDLEAQIGITIGRPTCVLLSKKKSTKSANDTLSLEDTLEDTRTDLYQHIQGMLGLNFLTSTAIRDFLERARDVVLHEPFNQIGLCTTEGHSPAVRDLHLNTHLFLLVIFCRMATLCDFFSRDLTNSSWSETPAADIIRSLNLHQPRQKLAYCRKMFRSANFILDSFMSLHHDDEEQTNQSWMRFHAAYIAAVILGIAKLRHEIEWHATTEKLKDMIQIFLELQQSDPSCHLFNTAVARLQDLNSVKEPASEAILNKHTGMKHNRRSAPRSSHTSPRVGRTDPLSGEESPPRTLKRSIGMAEGHKPDSDVSHEQLGSNDTEECDDLQPQIPTTQSYDAARLGHWSFFEDNSATYSEPGHSFTNTSAGSSATSFCESDMSIQAVSDMPFTHPGPPFAYPFPYDAFHPPMTWNNTMYHLSNHDSAPIPVQLTGVSQYGNDLLPVSNDLASSFGLQSASTTKPSIARSLQSSPLQSSTDETLHQSKLSPEMAVNSQYPNPSQILTGISGSDMRGKSFFQQVKAPIINTNLPIHSPQPMLESRHLVQQLHPASILGRDDQQHISKGWLPVSNLAPACDSHSHLGEPVSLPQSGRRTSIQGDIHANPNNQRQPPESCYPHLNATPAPQILGTQAYRPEHMAYLDPMTGLFEQQGLQAQYQHNHPSPYARYGATSSGQLQEQWRRMSIDTGAPAGTQF